MTPSDSDAASRRTWIFLQATFRLAAAPGTRTAAIRAPNAHLTTTGARASPSLDPSAVALGVA
jgi:hypothetical protein